MLAMLLGRAGTSVIIIETWPRIYKRPSAATMNGNVAHMMLNWAPSSACSGPCVSKSCDA
ncbi:hypothetical protein OAH97_00675 [Octadecabacter sp.]|nr:hypothetical protein [Octadecabacter sp.]